MPELFRLVKEEFSQESNEWRWTYQCLAEYSFNKKIIKEITITDHWKKKPGREKITKEFILELLVKMNGEILEPMEYEGKREPYEWEIVYDEKPYVLFFWFADHNPHGLWIRNCHRVDW